jgi:23S rRNA pseudouridine1911/1915/1917 synthase
VRASAPGRASAAPIHRLGRGTSGAILFGKTGPARQELSRQLREGRMGKLYLAIVPTGLPASFVATHPIGPVATRRGVIHAACPTGKPSRTRGRVLAALADGRALVAAWPITGRPDQIRIHLAALGAPIEGDPLFAPGGALLDARPGDCGYLLHAAGLSFAHPATGRRIRVRSLPSWPHLAAARARRQA